MHPDQFSYIMIEWLDREGAITRVEKAVSCINFEVE
jgi:hypothetical protein